MSEVGFETIPGERVNIKAWTRGVAIEATALQQLRNVSALPFLHQHIAATAGVECRKDSAVIDETPAAYKDIDAVMLAQADLVEIVHTLKQVVCVKG